MLLGVLKRVGSRLVVGQALSDTNKNFIVECKNEL